MGGGFNLTLQVKTGTYSALIGVWISCLKADEKICLEYMALHFTDRSLHWDGIQFNICAIVLIHYYIGAHMKQHNEQQKKALKASEASLYKAFLTMNKAEEVQQFLLDLCTPSELEAIVDRWWTASLLKEGRSYRDISEVTGVSVTTIGRVARFLTMGEGGYRLALRREQAARK